MPMFDDNEHEGDVSESEAIDYEIGRGMTVAHKIGLSQDAIDVFFFGRRATGFFD